MGFSCTASFRSSPSHHPRPHGPNLPLPAPAPPLIRMRFPQSRSLSPSVRLSASSTIDNASGLGARRLCGVVGIREGSEMRAGKFRVRASSGEEVSPVFPSRTKLIAISSAVTVILAVLNRVLYKLALVPMKRYPFFLAQITTFGYVAIYFSILYTRYRIGIVTDEMLSLPKLRFVAIGFLEALGVAAGMSAGAMLPGPAIPILSQTYLVWQLAFSSVILRRKYSVNQTIGCLLVAAGVVVAVTSGSNRGDIGLRVDLIWPAVMIASSAFQAVASIIKVLQDRTLVFFISGSHISKKNRS